MENVLFGEIGVLGRGRVNPYGVGRVFVVFAGVRARTFKLACLGGGFGSGLRRKGSGGLVLVYIPGLGPRREYWGKNCFTKLNIKLRVYPIALLRLLGIIAPMASKQGKQARAKAPRCKPVL
jgi:hypothetical protein